MTGLRRAPGPWSIARPSAFLSEVLRSVRMRMVVVVMAAVALPALRVHETLDDT